MNTYNEGGQYVTDHIARGYSASAATSSINVAKKVYLNKPFGMSDEQYEAYLETYEESYDITRHTFALYTLHPDALYAI